MPVSVTLVTLYHRIAFVPGIAVSVAVVHVDSISSSGIWSNVRFVSLLRVVFVHLTDDPSRYFASA